MYNYNDRVESFVLPGARGCVLIDPINQSGRCEISVAISMYSIRHPPQLNPSSVVSIAPVQTLRNLDWLCKIQLLSKVGLFIAI